MQTLTYGRKRPDNLDRGNVFFDALRDNITKDDSHNHNGINSAPIAIDSIPRFTVDVLATGWTSNPDGTYSKIVTMPGSYVWNSAAIRVVGVGGTYNNRNFFPDLRRITDTTFELRLFLNNQAFLLVFS